MTNPELTVGYVRCTRPRDHRAPRPEKRSADGRYHVIGVLPGGLRVVIESHASQERASARAALLGARLEGYERVVVEAASEHP